MHNTKQKQVITEKCLIQVKQMCVNWYGRKEGNVLFNDTLNTFYQLPHNLKKSFTDIFFSHQVLLLDEKKICKRFFEVVTNSFSSFDV